MKVLFCVRQRRVSYIYLLFEAYCVLFYSKFLYIFRIKAKVPQSASASQRVYFVLAFILFFPACKTTTRTHKHQFALTHTDTEE